MISAHHGASYVGVLLTMTSAQHSALYAGVLLSVIG